MKKMLALSLIISPIMQAVAADCGEAQTQPAMNQCFSAHYKEADKTLNSTYQKVLKLTSGEQRNLLQSSQKKWISYRDADCKFQTYKSSDGSVSPMNITICLQTKTEQRTKELESMLKCPEGDVSCPL
ncbi:lysozyme inhibitor LprI family protein [Pantoea vagans]|uniref:lysozyme inhibitor LprI family protein n=1 Tax=Pantoea vagans TaxID=470934 RepID=UPI003969D8AB